MKKLCILALSAIILTGCSNNPNSKIKFSESDFEFAAVSKITDSYSAALSGDYKHFTIRNGVKIADVTSVSRVSYKPSEGFLFANEQGLSDFLGGGRVDLSESVVGSDEIGDFHQLNADGGYPYFVDYDGGSVVWIGDETAEKFFLTNENITVKRFYCCNDKDDVGDEKFQLKDCEMSVNEAIKKCAEFAKGLEKFGYPELSPFEVRVEKIGGEYAFRIDMVQTEDGVALRAANCGFEGRGSSANDVFTGRLGKINANPVGYSVVITSSGGVGCFRNNENVFCEQDKEAIDRIITPRSALEYIDDNLSEKSAYEVDYIGLENKIYWADPETGVYSSTPMWTVSLYDPAQEKLFYALVDCETGDFSFYSQCGEAIDL